MNKNRKSTSGLMIIALLGLIIMAFILFSTGGDTQTMKYSEVIDYFEQGKVSEFVLNMKNGAMQLTLTEEATQELLEQQPGMTLGGQQTGALGGLWGGSSSGAASDTAKQAVLTYTLPYAGELLDKVGRPPLSPQAQRQGPCILPPERFLRPRIAHPECLPPDAASYTSSAPHNPDTFPLRPQYPCQAGTACAAAAAARTAQPSEVS